MLRSTSFLSVALVAGLAFSAPTQEVSYRLRQLQQPSGCENSLRREPVVIYSVSGSTFVGPVQESLIIYNDGSAVHSESGFFASEAGSRTASVDPAYVRSMHRSLASAGAFELCDEQSVVQDMPLTTVTILRGDTEAAAHSFSYYLPSGAFGDVENILQQFIEESF